MNLNKLAQLVAKKEKGKSEVNIAQIKEIMKIIFTWLAKQKPLEIFKMMKKYQ